MEEVADFVGKSLEGVRHSYDFLVRPHPSYPEFGALLSRHGFKATQIATANVIPLSDLYVAFASATIRWSIACGIPTVNYDLFGYDYDEYKGVAGVFNVASKEDFSRVVATLSPESEKYVDAASQIKASGGTWSMLDGKSVERIEAVLRGCVALRTADSPA
jgi:hypothetical protein